MDDNTISYLIKYTLRLPENNTYYKGTFTSDEILLPELKIKLGKKHIFQSFIVNTIERDDSSVGHWLSIILFYNGNRLLLKYFDSFAESFKRYKNIAKYIYAIKLECLNNNVSFKLDTMAYAIQSNDSKMCGVYSAYCVIKSYVNPNRLLKTIFKEFTRNRSLNDKKIMFF